MQVTHGLVLLLPTHQQPLQWRMHKHHAPLRAHGRRDGRIVARQRLPVAVGVAARGRERDGEGDTVGDTVREAVRVSRWATQ